MAFIIGVLYFINSCNIQKGIDPLNDLNQIFNKSNYISSILRSYKPRSVVHWCPQEQRVFPFLPVPQCTHCVSSSLSVNTITSITLRVRKYFLGLATTAKFISTWLKQPVNQSLVKRIQPHDFDEQGSLLMYVTLLLNTEQTQSLAEYN